MRIVKKILFDRVTEITQFKKIKQTFNKIKSSENITVIGSVKDISRLNFYFIIDHFNVVQEKVNYNKIFPDSKNGEPSCINYKILAEEQEKIKKILFTFQEENPDYFKKLGIIRYISGCYILATTKKNNSIMNIDLNKKEYCIAIKLDHKKGLPKEFEQMCTEYAKKNKEEIEKEHGEYQRFMTLSNEQQDNIIQDFLHNIQFPPMFFNESESEEIDGFLFDSQPLRTGTTIESAAENNIENIKDINFLEAMMNSALERENYEFCAKIRDKIRQLRNIIPNR